MPKITKKSIISQRRLTVEKRKIFIPSLLTAIISWVLLFAFIFLVNPDRKFAIPIFLALFFITILFTALSLIEHLRRSTLISIVITIFLILRYIGIGNIINLILLTGSALALEIYFSKRS